MGFIRHSLIEKELRVNGDRCYQGVVLMSPISVIPDGVSLMFVGQIDASLCTDSQETVMHLPQDLLKKEVQEAWYRNVDSKPILDKVEVYKKIECTTTTTGQIESEPTNNVQCSVKAMCWRLDVYLQSCFLGSVVPRASDPITTDYFITHHRKQNCEYLRVLKNYSPTKHTVSVRFP